MWHEFEDLNAGSNRPQLIFFEVLSSWKLKAFFIQFGSGQLIRHSPFSRQHA
jgi:hypothetical protein